MEQQATIKTNPLYPVFFRLDRLRMLIVGAGEVGHEKLSFILKSSPNAQITVVAPEAKKEVVELMERFPKNVTWFARKVVTTDVLNHDLVVAATSFKHVNQQVHAWAKKAGKIINVADTPALCDFYMGSIVTRGDLKVAISTNGKSPTFAKRFRQLLESVLPQDTHQLIGNLHQIRNELQGTFIEKVNRLNDITKTLINRD